MATVVAKDMTTTTIDDDVGLLLTECVSYIFLERVDFN